VEPDQQADLILPKNYNGDRQIANVLLESQISVDGHEDIE
jgi:hypothetical protein